MARLEALLIATRNQGKLGELAALLAPLGIRVLSLDDVPPVPPVIEDGSTFEHNARKKAMETSLATGLPTLADDSGLCVDALDGAPGVYSARYAGPDASDTDNNQKLLRAMAGFPEAQRTARFVAVVALCLPPLDARTQAADAPTPETLTPETLTANTVTFRGQVEGTLLPAPRGTGGFGYDPLFVPEPSGSAEKPGRTMAELTPAEKHRISHRGHAMGHLIRHLEAHLRDAQDA